MSFYGKVLDTIDLYVLRVIDLPGSGKRRFSVEIHTPPPHKTATVFFMYHGTIDITINYPLSLPHPEKLRERIMVSTYDFILRETRSVLGEVFPSSDIFFVHDNFTPEIYPSPHQLSPHTIKSLPINTPSLLYKAKRGAAMRFPGDNEDFSISFCLVILYKVKFEGENPLTFLYNLSKEVIPRMKGVLKSLNHPENFLDVSSLPSEVKFVRCEPYIFGRVRNQPTYHGYLFFRGGCVKATSFNSFTFTIAPYIWEHSIISYLDEARNDLSMLVDRLLFVHSLVDPPTNEGGDTHSRYIKLLLSLKGENDPLKHKETT